MYSELKTYLKQILSAALPGATAHYKMLPPGRRLKNNAHEQSRVKLSSVLVLIFPEGNQLFTCLMKRPTTMKHHPGQISFPGGKIEKDDASAEMTALREAQEEVGINPEQIEILGSLSELYIEVSQFSIQPFLAWADQRPNFEVNYREVEELIIFPLNRFVENETISTTELDTMTGLLKVNYYPFNGEIVWGATAMILSELIEILKQITTKAQEKANPSYSAIN